jgi:hypothetical protein
MCVFREPKKDETPGRAASSNFNTQAPNSVIEKPRAVVLGLD